MISPLTPQEYRQPPLGALRADGEERGRQAAAFWQKVGGRCTQNPWISGRRVLKSLNVDRKCITGWWRFSTCRRHRSTCLAGFSTCGILRPAARSFFYLSLLIKEKRERRQGKRKTAIHGLERLPKKASTGWTANPRVIRGYRWIGLFL